MKTTYFLLLLFVNILSAPITATNTTTNNDEDLYERITTLEARMNRFENELAIIKSQQEDPDLSSKQNKKNSSKAAAKQSHSK